MLELKSYMSDKKKKPPRNHLKSTAGRPTSKIDWDEVKESLTKGCTGQDIAAEQGVYYATLTEACRREKKIETVQETSKGESTGVYGDQGSTSIDPETP